ncbi:4'-phosphopantetheinyl transferase [Flammula alnicola]|nr:4'-phosphopantetheinyl transferase [Flammula alnicola]
MTILGIGVDLVHVPRIAALLSRRRSEKFASKILSPEEYLQWLPSEPSHQIQFLAVRWCVKEAAYKAMYPTVRPTWKEITYRGLSSLGQKPCLVYHPVLSENRSKIGQTHVSVSHDGEYVFSTVFIEGTKILNSR